MGLTYCTASIKKYMVHVLGTCIKYGMYVYWVHVSSTYILVHVLRFVFLFVFYVSHTKVNPCACPIGLCMLQCLQGFKVA